MRFIGLRVHLKLEIIISIITRLRACKVLRIWNPKPRSPKSEAGLVARPIGSIVVPFWGYLTGF